MADLLLPNIRGVSNVRTAFEALKPREVLEARDRKKVNFKHRGRRHTAAYVRQGEWSFLPEPDLSPPQDQVRHADHRTIGLTCWHRVVANAEITARGMGNVAFLD